MFETMTRMGASAAGTYEIEKSLRFDLSSDTFFTRTPSSSADDQKQTYSFWCKRNVVDEYHYVFSAWNGTNVDRIGFTYDGQFFVEFKDGGATEAEWHSHNKHEDPSAWYHCVVAIDTTLATENHRFRVYINGVEITDWDLDNDVSQNYELKGFGQSGKYHVMGAIAMSASSHQNNFNGYVAEFHFIDGAQKLPTDFGKTDPATGQWIPIEYKGTYGSQGWYLNFSDNSNTTAGTLGADSSGNGLNWTPNNFSVAAGEGNDSVIDTPTNNYCTWNELDSKSDSLSNGGLVFKNGSGALYQAHGTIAIPEISDSNQKYYFEATVDQGYAIGIAPLHISGANSETTRDDTYVLYSNGSKYSGSSASAGYTSSWSSATVIGVAIGDGKIKFSKAGTDLGDAYTGLSGSYKPYTWAAGSTGSGVQLNCGQQPFQHTPPTGYVALCTANLPEPTIKKGTDYFNSVLYTGNGSAGNAKTGVGFQPDLVWIKQRNTTRYHQIFDVVRGATKWIGSNISDVEDTISGVTSFDSDGFTLGNHDGCNQNTGTYVAWNWKESASAGFDIVSYTGNGSNRTIAHSLGAQPNFMLVKNRDVADSWQVYHDKSNDTPEDYTAFLDQTNGFYDDIVWNDTKPTSSVFHLGVEDKVNANGEDFIAYLWSNVEGYSKAGVYEGKGNADGTFVYTGFKPAWVMTKGTWGSNWNVYDIKRNTYNVTNRTLYPNLNNAESTESSSGNQLNLLSNGFKLRGSNDDTNKNDNNFIYLAFAERPFKYSNAE